MHIFKSLCDTPKNSRDKNLRIVAELPYAKVARAKPHTVEKLTTNRSKNFGCYYRVLCFVCVISRSNLFFVHAIFLKQLYVPCDEALLFRLSL